MPASTNGSNGGLLSSQAEIYLGEPEFLIGCLSTCNNDQYSEGNRKGFINLGTAVNSLCEDIIKERFDQGDLFQHEPSWQHYMGLNGTKDLLQGAASFLQTRLAKGCPISASNLRMTNGVSVGLELVSWILADPGEVILIPTPTYARFFADMSERMKTKVVGLHLEMEEDSPFCLTPELVEQEILRLKSQGERVKGFLYCNPNNPLGVVYPLSLTLEIMEVCKRHQVHFISDEIYALSVFDQSTKFSSILSVPRDQLPDPERTHFLWGLSKDFGLAGFRMGFIHSFNTDFIKCLDGMNLYTSGSVHIQQIAAKLLSDHTWLSSVYFPTNISRLSAAYTYVTKRLSSLSIPVFRAQAGLFCWADFRSYLETKDEEGETRLFKQMFDKSKVYLVPGSQFYCTEPGWFRIIFAVSPDKLEKGLDRVEQVLKGRRNIT